MSESKHTPGNWFVSDQPDAELHRIAIHADVVRGDWRYELRGLAYATWQDCDQRDEYEANARLIAAAPTMLEALKEAERFLDYFANGRVEFIGAGTPHTALEQVSAAIAKATGETA